MRRGRASRRGMTLVEVLVVIAILTVLMCVLSVGVVRSMSVSSSGYGVLEVPAPLALAPEGRSAPVLEAAYLDLVVDTTPALDGLSVGTRYGVDIDATFQVRNREPEASQVQLRFPFPGGIADIRDVELLLTDEDGAPAGGQVHYGLSGLSWVGSIPPDQVRTARLRYAAQGRDTLSLSLSDGRQPLRLRATVALPGAPSVVIPADALQPTGQTDTALTWEIDGLLSDAPITLELPAGDSVLGHLAAFGRLAALGVALFGAGFWYLSEGVRPGRLDDFRLGGLLLLTLNYGLFYAIFLVVSPSIGAGLAVPIAAGISWPLLTVHVARITGRDFASRRALPLAVVSTLLVLGLAYADGHRPLIGLGGLIIGAALVTTTWRRWSMGRRSWQREQAHARQRARQARALEARLKTLRAVITTTSGHLAVAHRVLEESPDGLGPERAEVLRRVERLEGSVARARRLCAPSLLPDDAAAEHLSARAAEIERAAVALEDQAVSLERATATLERAGTTAIEALFRSMTHLEAAEGGADLAEIEARSGTRATQPRLHSEVESHLGELLSLRQAASSLRARVSTPEGRDLRAQASEARRLGQAIEQTTDLLKLAAGRLREVSALSEPGEAALHCPGCGHPHPERSHFCPSCGLQRPEAFPCDACGHVNRLPTHLLKDGWRRLSLHCASCGAGVQRQQHGPRGSTEPPQPPP